MGRAFIFELGCEDLPALQIRMAKTALYEGFVKRCEELRIKLDDVNAYATPRRLALVIQEVAERQEDLSVLRVGPAVAAAYDAAGNLTPAALGFLKGAGVGPEAIEKVTQEKKKGKPIEYIAVHIQERGAKTMTLLPGILRETLLAIHWARPMRWGSEPTAFARPVHWILAKFGDEVVDFEFCGIKAGAVTYGHRFMSEGPIEVLDTYEYVDNLRDAHVIVDDEERRENVLREAHAAAKSVGGHLVENDELLDEVVEILEWPVGIVGHFDETFLKLPREVLETSMCKNQRYFSVVDDKGNLMPNFVTLSNTEVKDRSIVARGNERVLRARLKDAEFFFAEDMRIKLEEYNKKLEAVRYVDGMGSVMNKVERIVRIAEEVAKNWKGSEINISKIRRCAELCKADLATGMVGEFPELQGVMGDVYGRECGEDPDVCLGIREHYSPRSASDGVATGTVGAIVGIAEKMDTIVALFALGRIPTGAADPFALRRSAVGLLRTLFEHKQTMAIQTIIECAIEAVYATRATLENRDKLAPLTEKGELLRSVSEFMAQRLRFMLNENHAMEVVDSVVLNGELVNIPSIIGRVDAISAERGSEKFDALIGTFKRVANIVRQAGVKASANVNVSLFECKEETAFHEAITSLRARYIAEMEASHFNEALHLLFELKAPADAFFDAVLVNCDDEKVRNNRYALLSSAETLLNRFADVRKL